MANPFQGLFGQVGGGTGFGGLLDPRSAALGGAAQALAQAGAPSRVPVSTGAAMANAMANATANYRQAQAAGMTQQMNKMKLQSQLLAMTQPTTDVKESNGRFVKVTTQPLYQMIGGKLSRHPEAGKVTIGEALNVGDPFKTRTGRLNTIYRLWPKIQNKTATPDEEREYKLASGFLQRDDYSTVQTETGPMTVVRPGFDAGSVLGGPTVPKPQPGQKIGQIPAPQVVGRSLSPLAQNKFEMQGAVEQKWEAYKTTLQKIGPTINPFTADYKELRSAYTAVMLALKDAANLGVLAGPDLDLLHDWLQDPTSVMAQIGHINPDYLMADVNKIDKTIGANRKRLNQQFGIKQAPDKAGPKLPPGIPAGSTPTGRMFVGKQNSKAPDGTQRLAD